MNESHYGWVVNTHYDWVNMLTKMQRSNPDRFKNFCYSEKTIYDFIEKIQHEQNIND